jgi:hypothetical protein
LSISSEYSPALQLAIATARGIAVIREVTLSTRCSHSPLEKIGRTKRFKRLLFYLEVDEKICFLLKNDALD